MSSTQKVTIITHGLHNPSIILSQFYQVYHHHNHIIIYQAGKKFMMNKNILDHCCYHQNHCHHHWQCIGANNNRKKSMREDYFIINVVTTSIKHHNGHHQPTRAGPIIAGKVYEEQPSGLCPSSMKGVWNVALSDAKTISNRPRTVTDIPTAGPLIAATRGLG